MPDDQITIPRKEYESLKEDAAMLQRLHDAGVDNWQGYSYTFETEDD